MAKIFILIILELETKETSNSNEKVDIIAFHDLNIIIIQRENFEI